MPNTDESVAVNTELLNQTPSISPDVFHKEIKSRELFAVVPGEVFNERQGSSLPATSFFLLVISSHLYDEWRFHACTLKDGLGS